jgi:hypothetical protein
MLPSATPTAAKSASEASRHFLHAAPVVVADHSFSRSLVGRSSYCNVMSSEMAPLSPNTTVRSRDLAAQQKGSAVGQEPRSHDVPGKPRIERQVSPAGWEKPLPNDLDVRITEMPSEKAKNARIEASLPITEMGQAFDF